MAVVIAPGNRSSFIVESLLQEGHGPMIAGFTVDA
jgi:hypothetical protein